jgi:hypothetical protein
VTRLVDGVAQFATVASGTYTYFRVTTDTTTTNLTLQLSPLSGAPLMFAERESSSSSGQYLLPSASNYTWRSWSSGSRSNSVVLSRSVASFVPGMTVMVGVTSATPSSFFIVASLGSAASTPVARLLDGLPQVCACVHA